MTRKQLLKEARTLGSAKVAALTGYPGDVVGRWLGGSVNGPFEAAFEAALAK